MVVKIETLNSGGTRSPLTEAIKKAAEVIKKNKVKIGLGVTAGVVGVTGYVNRDQIADASQKLISGIQNGNVATAFSPVVAEAKDMEVKLAPGINSKITEPVASEMGNQLKTPTAEATAVKVTPEYVALQPDSGNNQSLPVVDKNFSMANSVSESSSFATVKDIDGSEKIIPARNAKEYVTSVSNLPEGTILTVDGKNVDSIYSADNKTYYSVVRGSKEAFFTLPNGKTVDAKKFLPAQEPENKIFTLTSSSEKFEFGGVMIKIAGANLCGAPGFGGTGYSIFPDAGDNLIVISLNTNGSDYLKIKDLAAQMVVINSEDVSQQYRVKEVKTTLGILGGKISRLNVAFSVDKGFQTVDIYFPGLGLMQKVGLFNPGNN